MRPTRFLPAILLTALAAFGLWKAVSAIHQGQQAYRHSLYLAAHPLSPWIGSQPTAQNGWTLVGIQNAELEFGYQDPSQTFHVGFGGEPKLEGCLTLWFLAPPLPARAMNYNSVWTHVKNPDINADGITNQGETVELQTITAGDDPNHSLVGVTIPPGYSDSMTAIVVKVADQHGHTGQWRVENLPVMQHTLAAPASNTTDFQSGPVTLHAVAWRGPVPHFPQVGLHTHYALGGRIQPMTQHWEIIRQRPQWEWQPASPTTVGPSDTIPVPADGRISLREDFLFWNPGPLEPPYAKANHALRLPLTLKQFAARSETVTFFHVKIKRSAEGQAYLDPDGQKPMTSPSGVTVTLLNPLTVSQQSHEAVLQTIGTAISCAPFPTAYLPKSPVCRQFHQPAQITCRIIPPPGWGFMDGQDTGAVTMHGLQPFGPIPKSIPCLTVAITQRIDLQAIPAPLVVRISDHAPPKK